MSLVYGHAFAEALLGFRQIVDVETERAVVQPMVGVVLVTCDSLPIKSRLTLYMYMY